MSVARALAEAGFASADHVRIAQARAWRKNSHGGGCMPRSVVLGMYAVYRQTASLAATGRYFGRDATTMGFIFRRAGLTIRQRGGPNHRHDRATVRRWYDAYLTFKSLDAVGRLFGKRGNTIGNAFKSHGFPVRPRGGNQRWKKQIRDRAA